jgi:dipeptide/tripeptide permease
VLFRLLAPAFAWVALMLLVFLREYQLEYNWDFAGITRNSVVQFVMFIVFAHIVNGVIMKQLRYPRWKEHPERIVLISGTVLAVVVEILRSKTLNNVEFNVMNLILDIVGVLIGIVIFRLLYRSCC